MAMNKASAKSFIKTLNSFTVLQEMVKKAVDVKRGGTSAQPKKDLNEPILHQRTLLNWMIQPGSREGINRVCLQGVVKKDATSVML